MAVQAGFETYLDRFSRDKAHFMLLIEQYLSPRCTLLQTDRKDRQTDKQLLTDRQTVIDRQTNRYRQTDKQMHSQPANQPVSQPDKQTCRKIDRHVDRQRHSQDLLLVLAGIMVSYASSRYIPATNFCLKTEIQQFVRHPIHQSFCNQISLVIN